MDEEIVPANTPVNKARQQRVIDHYVRLNALYVGREVPPEKIWFEGLFRLVLFNDQRIFIKISRQMAVGHTFPIPIANHLHDRAFETLVVEKRSPTHFEVTPPTQHMSFLILHLLWRLRYRRLPDEADWAAELLETECQYNEGLLPRVELDDSWTALEQESHWTTRALEPLQDGDIEKAARALNGERS